MCIGNGDLCKPTVDGLGLEELQEGASRQAGRHSRVATVMDDEREGGDPLSAAASALAQLTKTICFGWMVAGSLVRSSPYLT